MSELDAQVVHVRDTALQYSIGMARSGLLTVDNHILHAKRMTEFLLSGETPLPAEMMVPDDLSAFAYLDGPLGQIPELETGPDLPWLPPEEPTEES